MSDVDKWADLAQRRDDELMALAAILAPDEITIPPKVAGKATNGNGNAPSTSTQLQSVLLTIPVALSQPSRVRVRTHVYTIDEDISSAQHGDDLLTMLDNMNVEDGRRSASSSAKNIGARTQSRKQASPGEHIGRDAVQQLDCTQDGQRNAAVHASKASCTSEQRTSGRAGSTYHIEEADMQGICFLPPVRLLVHLPPGYPDHTAPHIAHIGVRCIGKPAVEDSLRTDKIPPDLLAKVSSQYSARYASITTWVRSTLVQQWQDSPTEILYWWYDTVRETMWSDIDSPWREGKEDCLVFEEYVFRRANAQVRPDSGLASVLRTHDMLSKRKEFEGERFGCGICLEEKRGGKCFRLAGCGHVFCQDCLSDYLSSMIREGYLRQAAACPDPECVKARVASENAAQQLEATTDRLTTSRNSSPSGVITDDELLQIVGKELLDRLHDLQDKASASLDPSAGFCPRPSCQRLVRGDPKDVGTTYEAMRQCTCGYTYCLYCSKAWHGRNPCNIVSSTALIEAYQRSAPGSMERRTMELKYGRANLERMVRTHEEEQSNRAWIESNTQKCPCCSVFITKSFGCNHMACGHCNTHFCYRCGTRLPPNEPYRHFNAVGTPCYMKLFDSDTTVPHGVDEDLGDDPAVIVAWEMEHL